MQGEDRALVVDGDGELTMAKDRQLSTRELSAEKLTLREVLLYACWAGSGRRAADGMLGMAAVLLGAGINASLPPHRTNDGHVVFRRCIYRRTCLQVSHYC